MIRFNYNITNMNDKLGRFVPTVFFEARKCFDKIEICLKLEKIKDTTY